MQVKKLNKVNSDTQTKLADYTKQDAKKQFSAGFGLGIASKSIQISSQHTNQIFSEDHSKVMHNKTISQLNKIEDAKIFKQARDSELDNYQEESQNNQIGFQKSNNFVGSQERNSRGNMSPISQSSNQFNQYWQTSYTGASNAQALKQSFLNESKRSGVGSSNTAGLLTSQIFFKRKSINNPLSKSQSLNQFRSQNKTQYSSKINHNTISNFQSSKVVPTRSINDLLHRTNVTLDIQQSMAQMEQITQEVIKQNAFEMQNQQEQLQKLQGKFQRQSNELHNSKDRSLDNQNSQLMNPVQSRQYFIQVQQKLQKAQNDFMNNIQQRNSKEEKSKSQSDQINNFISFDKLQQQQQQQQQQSQRQKDNTKIMSDYSQISRTIQPSPISENKQQHFSAAQSNFKNSFHVSNSSYKPHTEINQARKASENIFSLTGTRDKLPHQDVLSLCNQNFIDNLNALRKVIRKEQQIDQQRITQEETQNQQMNIQKNQQTQKIEGLEGHSIHKPNNKVLINKLLADSYYHRKLTHLKSEVSDQNQLNQDQIQLNKSQKKLNSLRMDNSHYKSSKIDIWKGSSYFKNNNNYQKSFTLKNLKGAFDQNSHLNPNGTPKNQQYYLQDTVKQSDHLSNKSRPLKQLSNQQNGDQQLNDSQLSNDDNDLDMQLNGSNILNLQENNILNYKESEFDENNQLNNTNSSFQNSDHSASSSFYKILKKQNMQILGDANGGNIQNYDIIDKKFDKIFQTRFHKNLAIRKVDMVYNIKHLAILKYKREKKLLEGSQDPKDLLEYISAKNKIQILLLNAKKISNLQKVALIIENKINQQNSRINSIVDQLLIKFDINQTQ